jgi:hypothetical protein
VTWTNLLANKEAQKHKTSKKELDKHAGAHRSRPRRRGHCRPFRRSEIRDCLQRSHKEGYGAVSLFDEHSPGRRTRVRPCVAMRRICAGVSVGNTCSTRELLSGSPRLTWLIVVFGGAAALPDYLSLFCRDRCGEPRSQVEVHLTYRSIPMRSTPSTCLI